VSSDYRHGPHADCVVPTVFYAGIPSMNPIAGNGFAVQARPIMESPAEPPEGQGIRYWWPPVVWVVSLGAGYVTASVSRQLFMSTHGFFEIAAMVALMAAIIYAIRLRPFRKDRRLRIPFFANLGLVILMVAAVIMPWAWMLLK
jgi:hypothetical protein